MGEQIHPVVREQHPVELQQRALLNRELEHQGEEPFEASKDYL